MDATGYFLTALMLAPWALLAYDLYGIVTSGPLLGGESRYSRGWELFWAYVLAVGVWFFLGLIFYRLQPPAGLWVYLTSGGAAIAAFLLMGEGETRWPAAIPLLLPGLLLGAALSGHWAALRLPRIVASAIPCLLAIGMFGSAAIGDRAGRNAMESEKREKNLSVVATIGEDQPVWRWMPLLSEESGVRAETLAALRKLQRRQADIEAMLAGDYQSEALDLMPSLDLQVTPRLQQLVDAWLRKTSEYAATKPGGGDTILEGDFLFAAIPPLRWLRSHGGDCREGISRLRAAALEYQDTKERRKYLKELDRLLQ